jgi:hypothetical protein
VISPFQVPPISCFHRNRDPDTDTRSGLPLVLLAEGEQFSQFEDVDSLLLNRFRRNSLDAESFFLRLICRDIAKELSFGNSISIAFSSPLPASFGVDCFPCPWWEAASTTPSAEWQELPVCRVGSRRRPCRSHLRPDRFGETERPRSRSLFARGADPYRRLPHQPHCRTSALELQIHTCGSVHLTCSWTLSKTVLFGRLPSTCLSAPIICASVCLLFDILLPLSFVRNHTRTCSESGDQVSRVGCGRRTRSHYLQPDRFSETQWPRSRSLSARGPDSHRRPSHQPHR